MEKSTEVVKILLEEYGIKTMAELNEAIAKLGTVDISLFCGELPSTKKEKVS